MPHVQNTARALAMIVTFAAGTAAHAQTGTTPPPRTRTPIVRAGTMVVRGRLPAADIERVVQMNLRLFESCYGDGLRTNPNLQGRVDVRFVIGRDGAVTGSSNGGSVLPNTSVVTCVVDAFRRLTFPPPSRGTVTVTYPMTFSSSG